MDDIIEKLRLLNYEINFCKKFHNEPITKFYFACNIYGYDFNYENNKEKENFPVQFAYFYDLCNWLLFIINNNININNLTNSKIEFKQYDKTLKNEVQLNELVSKLQKNKIKVVVNNRFKYGYGDSVCSVITQLCDKYLMNQNYIFKTPKFNKNKENKVIIENNFDDIILEDNINTNIGFKANTNYNFGNHFTVSTKDGSNNLFYNGFGVKKFISNGNVFSNNSNNIYNSNLTNNNTDKNENNNINNNFYNVDDFNNNEINSMDEKIYEKEFKEGLNIIKNDDIDVKEWEKELERVSINLNFNEMIKEKKLDKNNKNNKKVFDKIKEFSNYFDDENFKIIKDDINNYNYNINEDLKKIEKIEKNIKNSSNNNIRENIEKIKLTNSAINNYEEELMNIEEDIEFKEEEKNRILNKINKFDNNEKNLLNEDNNENKIKNIKTKIDGLIKEISNFDREIGIYNTNLWEYREKNNNNNENENEFNNENYNLFDEELK
jgi:estrogen-related receptor beta like 1